ncbi:hypothetical protein SLA2020_249630 [Shorea laevis]
MGCTVSKPPYEDTVRRCQERRRLMKEAVHALHLWAAAHADYCCSLRVTGSALSSFAAGEPLSVSDQTPVVLLHSPNSHPSHVHPVPPSPSLSLHPPHPRPDLAPALSSHEDLKEIGDRIKKNFDKVPAAAAAAGDRVEMLEIGSSSFAAAEPHPVSDQSPAVLLHSPNSHPSHVHPVPPAPSPCLDPPPPHSAPASSHESLKEIVDAIKENFDKAAAAGDQVSEMLEIGRAQFDRSFRQLKKTVYHSSGVLSNLSSRWTSKPPLAVKYGLDTAAVDEPRGSKSLCSTLYELLAWENKHCGEVMAREVAKIEHEKKLLALQSQEYKGGNETKLDKTKASIKRLHSLITVNSQAVSTTSTSIIVLRDSDLVPQLVELCHGFLYMWRSMRQYHEVQNHIVQQVSGPVNICVNGDSTSELRRRATHDLESVVAAWHSSFCRLIKFQRDFIRSLHGWFELTLIPVSNDNVDGNGQPSTVSAFINQWKLALDQVPDTVASEAIKSFIKAVHDISVKQTEEHRIKKRTETLSKEFKKKASALRSIERKFYHPYPMVGTSVPATGPDNAQVLDAQDPLADKKSELADCQRRMGDKKLRLSKAVEVTRAVTLNNLRTGLSRVFQELTSVCISFTEALDTVCPRS